MAILGHVAQTRLSTGSHRSPGDVVAEERNRSTICLCGADDRVNQLSLSVAFDSSDTDDLTLVYPEADTIDNWTAVPPV